MSRPIAAGVSLLCLLCTALLAQDAWKPDSEVGNFQFNLPDGWKKIDTKDGPMLVPKNLPKGGICFIAFRNPEPINGSLRSLFQQKWTEWQREFKVVDAASPTTQHHKHGFDVIRIDARVSNQQMGYSEFVFALAQVGNRAESYFWVNNTAYYSYRDSLDSFEQSLQFAGNPAASASKQHEPSGGEGMSGLYIGYKMRGMAGLLTHFEYLAFFPDGNVIRYLPEQGLDHFNFAHAVKTSREYCGRYDAQPGKIQITWGDNNGEVASRSGNSFKIAGDSYFPAPNVDSVKLAGTYRREGADLARYYIKFSSDGHFAENGMLPLVAYDKPNNQPGQGTYSIENYTLHLNYADGRKISLSFFVFPEDELQKRSRLHVNTYPLVSQR